MLNTLIVENSIMFSTWLKARLKIIEGTNITGIIEAYQPALESILSDPPHVVILDLEIEGGNGLEILKTIKKNNLETTVIIFTNHTIYKSQCKQLNAEYFFDKSNDFEEMINTIKKLAEENSS